MVASLHGWRVACSVGWLVACLAGYLVSWSVRCVLGWRNACLIVWLLGCLAGFVGQLADCLPTCQLVCWLLAFGCTVTYPEVGSLDCLLVS